MQLNADWIENPDTKTVLKTLMDAGYTALFVGGCVRNAILKRNVNDIDIATSAPPEIMLELFQSSGFKTIPTGIEHGTITVISNKTTHEITTFRKDVSTDGRHATVAFSTDVKEDAQRRDFTMNAIYADISGKIIDPLGGLSDATSGHLRFIGNADQRIKEDYLRILRFFRFFSGYANPDYGFDPNALDAIGRNISGLHHLSKERIWAELKKLLSAPNPAPSIATMGQLGVLNAVISGADYRYIAPLIHIEEHLASLPNALRRLVVLGGQSVPASLRLSRAETRRYKTLADAIGNGDNIAELTLTLGGENAIDILALRAAVFETLPCEDDIILIKQAAQNPLPISGADLTPFFTGIEIKAALKQARKIWIESNFRASKQSIIEKINISTISG